MMTREDIEEASRLRQILQTANNISVANEVSDELDDFVCQYRSDLIDMAVFAAEHGYFERPKS